MHQRLPKKTPLQTIGYEVDMFRHCARTLAHKKARFQETATKEDAAEYYLDLEGFLLHLRNLVAFLTNRRPESTDLGINRPKDWAERSVEQREYSDLLKSAKAIDRKYEQLVEPSSRRTVEAIMKQIYEQYPDPPGLPARDYDTIPFGALLS